MYKNGKEMPLTNIQLAYLVGRSEEYEMGGVSTHAYYELITKLNIDKMESAVNQIIKAQPMLRAIITNDGKQVILNEVPEYKIERIDLSKYNEAEKNSKIQEYRKQMSHEIFETEKWPMFSFKALKLNEEDNYFLISIDLLIADGGSISILFQEIINYCKYDIEVYTPSVTFEQFIQKIIEEKTKPRYFKEMEYWREKAYEIPLSPALPIKKEAVRNYPQFARKSMRLPKDKWKKLQKIAKEHNTSETIILLCLYAKVLAYWSNQESFTINYTLSSRKKMRGDIDRVIGDFTSAMPIIIKQESDLSIWKQAEQIKNAIFTSYKHVSYFDGMDVIKLLAKEKGLENSPVLPVVFTSMLFKDKNFNCIDDFGKLMYSVSQTPQVYLDCQVMEVDGQLSVTWDYVENLFENDIIERMFIQLEKLIYEVCEPVPDFMNIFQLDEKSQKLLVDYNNTEQIYKETTLYNLIKEHLITGGNKIAVKDAESELSYEKLNVLSDQIAYELEQKGIGAGDYVGVLGERKVETIVNIVGIVKSGAAYIPIDPTHPKERRKYILEQGKCKAFLKVENVKAVWDGKNKPTGNKIALPQDPAYVIYTSGSTGTPKGVVISNRSICNTILDINKRFSICKEDKFAGISSYCFDLSVYDIFGSLSMGAENIIFPDSRDIPYIADVVQQENITVWNTVPAIMELYIDELDRRKDACGVGGFRYKGETRTISLESNGLQVVMLSGDWIPVNLPERIKNYYEDAEIYSLGGATEASIWSIYYPIKTVKADWGSIPYGYPLANQKMYVMHHTGKECPIGIIGEICIGGIGVALGYQNDVEKTSNAFIHHEDYGYIYRTGDYGVLTKEGYMEFKGRRDAQVKIRGHRIELGEIESVLMKDKRIEKAVVVTKKKQNGLEYLCAYIVCKQMPEKAELVELLSKYLPEYMIPQKFVQMTKMLLTANGKVDKNKLPEPEEAIEQYIEPRNKQEEMLQKIWEQVLGRKKIGIYENFFEAGGDSISMVKIASQIEKVFHKKVSLKLFLRYPTIADMVSALRNMTNSNNTQIVKDSVVIDMKEQIDKEFPLSDVQMAYLFGGEEGFELGGISAHAFYELETKLDIDRFEDSLNKVIAYQPMLRTVITKNSKQKILAETMHYEIERINLSSLDPITKEQKLQKIRMEMSTKKSDPYKWPLFHFCSIDMGEERKRLLIDFNLLISDGTSMRILVEELMEFYNGKRESFVPMEYSFPNYILDKNKMIGTYKWKEDQAYWHKKLNDFPEAPNITKEIHASEIKNPHYARIEMKLEKNKWDKAKEYIKEKGVSPSAVLETIYSYVLAYWSNQPHHGINVTVFNRYPFHQDVENMIGDFTSIMLLDVDLERKKSFWENVQEIQNTLLEGMEHNTYDGIQFIRELSKQRGNTTNALMPIVFTSMIFHDKRFDELDNFGDIVYSISQTPQVYLDCQVMEINGSLSVTWDYVEEMFDSDKIIKMFNQFKNMITMVSEREKEIDSELVLDEKTIKVIEKYNDTNIEIPKNTLYYIIKDSLQSLGEKIAVKDKENELSYQQLEKLSNQIACYLEDEDIGAGDFVGVLAERNLETIVNIIGVVKSGAAYIPLDPEHPEERRKFILQQSKSKICLTKKDVEKYKDGKRRPRGNRAATPDDPAYVIYTSGSTGVPKGVVITNDAVCNTIQDVNHRFGITKQDRIIGISSYCFDLSVYDIFGSLSVGAENIIIPDARDIPYIVDTVQKERITVWNTVPAIMELYMDELERRECSRKKEGFRNKNTTKTISLLEEGLSVVMLSGDWIPLNLPQRIKESYEDVEIYSLGGATEASIWSIYYKVDEVCKDWNSIPYGYPLANQTFHVMNYQGKECPIGVIGELYIGGRGVANGYQNDIEKTNLAFINHSKYGYMYRTGDYGVFSKKGYIEFKGRRDSQVKIRGHRIELGEIESVLMQLETVEKAVVIAKKKKSGQEYLCAYIVSASMPEEKTLQLYVKKYLPEYMVPQKYIHINQVVLTANGKIDKKSLPEPDEKEEFYIAPRNKGEEQVQKIWENTIGKTNISINENFFEAGGDSIAMVKIVAQVESKMNKKISFQTFLQNPTIAEMAMTLEKEQVEENCLCNSINSNKKCKYFLFPDIYGVGNIMLNLIETKEFVGVKYYDISTERSLEDLISYYIQDILNTDREDDIVLIGYSLGGNIAFEIAKRLEQIDVSVTKIILLDSYYVDDSSYVNNTQIYENYMFHMIEKNKVLVEQSKFTKKARDMYKMLRNFYMDGYVNGATVYYIESEGDEDFAMPLRQDNHKWELHIGNKMKRLKGSGKHSEMLKTPNVEKNKKIVSQILKEEI